MSASGKRFLIYALESGGKFQFADPEQFGDAIRTGELLILPHPGPSMTVRPSYMALVAVVDDYDFKLGRSRG